MGEPRLRRATADDVPAITACVNAAYSDYVARLDGLRPGPMLKDYAQVVRDDDAYVLEDDGAIIGVLVLVRGPHALLLDNVAVRPEFQKLGYGRTLLAFAEERARQAGFDELSLYTNEVMTENLALYSRLGYGEVARVREDGYRRVYLRKRLAERTADAPLP